MRTCKMKNLTNAFTILIVIFFLNACSSGGKKPVEKLYYRFPEVNIAPLARTDIQIKKPTAMGIIGNRPMVVQNSDGALKQMNNNFWLESPRILLQGYLEKVIIKQISNDKIDFTLNSHILNLEKKQNTAILSINFTLKDSNRNLIINKSYKNSKQLVSNSIPAFVRAISVLLEEMVQQLLNDMP